MRLKRRAPHVQQSSAFLRTGDDPVGLFRSGQNLFSRGVLENAAHFVGRGKNSRIFPETSEQAVLPEGVMPSGLTLNGQGSWNSDPPAIIDSAKTSWIQAGYFFAPKTFEIPRIFALPLRRLADLV
jgi:hypothetical protein